MKLSLRISEAARRLGVCVKTLRRWNAQGKMSCVRTVGGHRRIPLSEIRRLLSGDLASASHPSPRVALYCRVSSYDQKRNGDLERQREVLQSYCHQHQLAVRHTFSDVGSGLNTRRPGLTRLFRLIETQQVDRVVITYPDRLTRFGFAYLRAYFRSHGVHIHALYQSPSRTAHEELVEDLLAIITSFSGRIYGLRSHKHKKASQPARTQKASE